MIRQTDEPTPNRFCNRRPPKAKACRRGVTAVESALVLMALFVLVLGMLDLGIASFRRNLLAEAARRVVRTAILHGESADQPLGPQAIDLPADQHPRILAAVAPVLKTMRADEVRVQLTWQEESNATNGLVQVQIDYVHPTLMSRWWGVDLIPLQARATGTIE